MDEIINREENLPIFIEELRDMIFDSIAWYLDEKIVSSIIDGVYDAVKVKQSQYTINTKIPIYKTEMYCMTSMIDIIVHPRIRRLDMEQLPRILRTQVTAKLQGLTGLEYFNLILLGFGVDSRACGQTEIVAPSNIISALRSMNFLTHLILPNFCTNNIIKALSVTCKDTLSKLEIDHSLRVSDAVVPDMLKMQKLELLSMAGTPLTSQSLATILLGLPKLRYLPNGDFLCDCLEWMVYDSPTDFISKDKLPTLYIQEFCSSEDYHFHSKKQLELVSKMCPNIRRVKFFYDSELLCEIRTLESFSNLCELSLNGGDFVKDPLRMLFENVGHKLVKLEMNHVDNIDRHAIVQMSLCCKNLMFLKFSACSFLDYGALHRELLEYYNAGGLDTSEEEELSLLLRDQETFKSELESMIQPFRKLQDLQLSSQCSDSTIVFLLLHTPALRKLYIGGNRSISNEIFAKVLSFNPLKYLEELEISESEYLNKETMDMILNNFHNLRKLKGLKYWKGLTDQDRENIKKQIKKENLDLDVSDMNVPDLSVFTYKVELTEEQKRFLSTA